MARQKITVPATLQLSYEITRGERVLKNAEAEAMYETAIISFFVLNNVGQWEPVHTIDKAGPEPMPSLEELSESFHQVLSSEKCPFTQIDLAQFDEAVDAALNEFTFEHSSLEWSPLPESLARRPKAVIDRIIS